MRRTLSIFLFVLFTGIACAQTDVVFTGDPNFKPQEKKEYEWVKHLRGGLNFQIWPGNPFFTYLAPHIGYSPFKHFDAGLSFNYSYTRLDQGGFGVSTRTVLGPGFYCQYTFNSSFFLRAQYDYMHQPNYQALEPGQYTWVSYATAGCGFKQNISENVSLNSLLLYNFTPSPLSIFPNRVILQFGLTANLE